ncbi:hypothetical protein [Beduinella massiliensis]
MKKGCCALAWALLLCMACAGAAGEASLYVYGTTLCWKKSTRI